MDNNQVDYVGHDIVLCILQFLEFTVTHKTSSDDDLLRTMFGYFASDNNRTIYQLFRCFCIDHSSWYEDKKRLPMNVWRSAISFRVKMNYDAQLHQFTINVPRRVVSSILKEIVLARKNCEQLSIDFPLRSLCVGNLANVNRDLVVDALQSLSSNLRSLMFNNSEPSIIPVVSDMPYLTHIEAGLSDLQTAVPLLNIKTLRYMLLFRSSPTWHVDTMNERCKDFMNALAAHKSLTVLELHNLDESLELHSAVSTHPSIRKFVTTKYDISCLIHENSRLREVVAHFSAGRSPLLPDCEYPQVTFIINRLNDETAMELYKHSLQYRMQRIIVHKSKVSEKSIIYPLYSPECKIRYLNFAELLGYSEVRYLISKTAMSVDSKYY